MSKSGWIAVGGVAVFALAFLALSSSDSGEEPPSYTGDAARSSESVSAARRGPEPPGSRPDVQALEKMRAQPGEPSGTSVEDRLVEMLKTFYGETISDRRTQALLRNVRDHVRHLFPEDGDERFYAILKRAFPEHAEEIMATLRMLDDYDHWHEENEARLAEMTEEERQDVIAEKKREIFGDEDLPEALQARARRERTVKETMQRLAHSDDTTIDEKLDTYMDTLRETYEDTPEEYTLKNVGLLAKVFLGLDSVNRELAQMGPEERQAEINHIRREMGFTEEQIEEHQQIDQYRERRWENGLAYMEERREMVDRFEGEELKERLDDLRREHFGHEAVTIEREEQEGFFRYERRRVYGRN